MDGKGAPEINTRPTTAKLNKYFDGLITRQSTITMNMPTIWQWEKNTRFVKEAISLRDENIGGYASGTDTATTRKEYKNRLITGALFDDYCRLFNYGEYGQGVLGKKILDVGAGTSLFGAVANYVYGDTGTNVVSLDPAYGDESVIAKLKTAASVVPELQNEILPPNRAPHLVKGIVQELPFPDNTFDEVVSQWAVVLVPPEDLPLSIKEMCRVARSKIKLTPLISFVDIETLTLPKGISLTRQSLDGFTLEIDKKDAVVGEVLDWLEDNTKGDERKFQLQSSEDLIERRKKGYYYDRMLHFLKAANES